MMYKPFIGNTDQLPITVFAVVAKNDNNTFQISTSRDGSAVTFTDAGEGNTHQFEMSVTYKSGNIFGWNCSKSNRKIKFNIYTLRKRWINRGRTEDIQIKFNFRFKSN